MLKLNEYDFVWIWIEKVYFLQNLMNVFPHAVQYDPWSSFCNKRIYLPHIFIFVILLRISLQLKGYIRGLIENFCIIQWWASTCVAVNVMVGLWSGEIEDSKIVCMLMHIAVSYLIYRSYLIKLMYKYCVLLDSPLNHSTTYCRWEATCSFGFSLEEWSVLVFSFHNPSWTLVPLCMHNFIEIPSSPVLFAPRVFAHWFHISFISMNGGCGPYFL